MMQLSLFDKPAPPRAATAAGLQRFTEYRIGERSLLTPGTIFRATGGPYYEVLQPDGTTARMSMGDKGPYKFRAYCEQGRHKWIEAWGRDGFCVLPLVSDGRSPALPKLVRREYKVKGRVRRKERRGR